MALDDWVLPAIAMVKAGNTQAAGPLLERAIQAMLNAGADGIIIEVHNDPDKAICDAAQQVPTSEFRELTSKIEAIAAVVGKTVSRA